MIPNSLYGTQQLRELDRIAIEEQGIPGKVLMKRAGRACFRVLADWPQARHGVRVFCGTGNNGGDGFVIAALAKQRQLPVEIFLLGDAQRIKGDAAEAWRLARQLEVPVRSFQGGEELHACVVVDALLGTGLSGPVRAATRAAIEWINRPWENARVLAVDVPSGLCADTGAVLGAAVRAHCTVSFIGMKQGFLTHQGPEHCGRILFSDLGVPPEVYASMPPAARLLQPNWNAALLPRRRRDAHKGHFGHLLVLGGNLGMAGAAALAARTAARMGTGLVSAGVRVEHVGAVLGVCPEVMVHGIRTGSDLDALLQRVDAIVVGPGLGADAWGEQLLYQALRSQKPLVADADALNLLARRQDLPRRDDWLLTPHPGEAARLLGTDVQRLQQDRFAALVALEERFGGVVVLKGAGTLVGGGGEIPALCPYGNPGMASGGMGDVLSGVLGALLAQGMSLRGAAQLGVCLHGRAADLAARQEGEQGLLAGDLIPRLRGLLNSRCPVGEEDAWNLPSAQDAEGAQDEYDAAELR